MQPQAIAGQGTQDQARRSADLVPAAYAIQQDAGRTRLSRTVTCDTPSISRLTSARQSS